MDIGLLKTKQHIVHMKKGPDRAVYSVEDIDGNLIERHLTERQLASKFPGLKKPVEGGMADDAGMTPGDKLRDINRPRKRGRLYCQAG